MLLAKYIVNVREQWHTAVCHVHMTFTVKNNGEEEEEESIATQKKGRNTSIYNESYTVLTTIQHILFVLFIYLLSVCLSVP